MKANGTNSTDADFNQSVEATGPQFFCWRYNLFGIPPAPEYFWGPQKDLSISILHGYPYLIGLHYRGVYMGYPYPNYCLCAFWGPIFSFCDIWAAMLDQRIAKHLYGHVGPKIMKKQAI